MDLFVVDDEKYQAVVCTEVYNVRIFIRSWKIAGPWRKILLHGDVSSTSNKRVSHILVTTFHVIHVTAWFVRVNIPGSRTDQFVCCDWINFLHPPPPNYSSHSFRH
jgi:hypothetical protein